jgi:hypothetical protein
VSLLRSRRRALQRAIGQRVVVHTTDDRTLDGVLVGAYTDCLALAHAQLLQPGDAPDVPLGGEVLVHVSSLSLVQVAP